MPLIPGESQPSFTGLFAQLGLDNDPASIEQFLRTHRPLNDALELHQAVFWSQSQAQLLRETICTDNNWAIVVDQLNAALRAKPDLDAL